MNQFLCKLIFACAAVAEPDPATRAELAYGSVLYDYYQENYSEALLRVRVAQTQGHTAGEDTKFKLAEGSFAFSAQMFNYASSTFASVDPAEITQEESLRLAFHQSREYYRVGDWGKLSESLARSDLGATRSVPKQQFHSELEFIRAEVELNAGDFSAARERLDLLDKNDAYKMYGLFNLGSALRTAGQPEAAQVAFLDVARIDPKTDEMLDLRQRASLATAFLQREAGNVAKAEKILGNLPAEGRYRDLALASFGSLAMESGDYELAAKVWLRLQQQQLWTASTASARLGFPLSLENMERQDLALTHYRAAEQIFSQRAVKLDELSRQVEDPRWVRELLSVFSEGRANPELLTRWQDQLGHTDWLEWLSTESVDSLLLQWRDLRTTKQWLQALPSELSTLEAVASEQRRRASAAFSALADRGDDDRDDDGVSARHAALVARIDAQLAEFEALKKADVTPDPRTLRALASQQQIERLDRLQIMYDDDTPRNESAAAKWRERLDRLRGVLFWDIAESRSAVLEKMRSSIADVEKLSASTQIDIERLQQAQAGAQASFQADFPSYSQRAGDLAARVEGALAEREQQLALELKRGMQREAVQVQQYLLTARVAIARTLDQYAAVDEVSP